MECLYHCAITGNHNSQQEEMAVYWWPRLGADAKKNTLSWSLDQLLLNLCQQAGGTGSKYNDWRRNGLAEQ